MTLEDGTTVFLAADSAIKTDFSASRRQVRLLTGEAFFDVIRNPGAAVRRRCERREG